MTTPATCTAEGVKTYTCTVCSEVKTEPIAKNAHTFGDGVVTTPATCIAEGVMTYTCAVCSDTKTETIAKTDHTYKNKVTKATLTKDGSIATACSVCGVTKGEVTVISHPAKFTLSAAKFTYDGKAKKPTVTVKGADGKKIAASNYKVTYAKGGKNVGEYAVTVTFKGNYSGTKKLSFVINPAGTKLKSVKPGSKQLTVKWTKNTKQTDGYEIQYSTSKNFTKSATTTVTIKKNSTASTVIKKLKGGKKYYVRIRTYKTVGKTKYYSDWSSTMNATTKK